ncbi:MAG: hypothetical protein KME05_22520 [Gloeocapsa sp. UFS-A4-WI-NPMV-4B04]|nr:hypothetical protein [Gloeocapsa sp. UFS-A4-WI-NPMV-4B04]
MEAFLLSLSFMVTPIATQYDSVNPNASYQAIDGKVYDMSDGWANRCPKFPGLIAIYETKKGKCFHLTNPSFQSYIQPFLGDLSKVDTTYW